MTDKEARSSAEKDASTSSRAWDIKEHEGSFGKYMEAKNQKLRIQFNSKRKRSEGTSSNLFEGICIHVNGYTVPTHQELKDIMAQHGGGFENYFSNSRVTHIICSNLTDAKLKQYGKERNPVPVVHPSWIVESIGANRLLSHSKFILERLRIEPKQRLIQMPRSPGRAVDHSKVVDGRGDVISPKKAAEEEEEGGGGGGKNSIDKEKDFVGSFYKNSRLHFIGTWKAKIEAMMSAASDLDSPQPDKGSKVRQIIHVDIDCFFASVAIQINPSLKGRPVAVCHSDYQNGTAEISSANYEAREFGIKAGMYLSTAKELCPELKQVPYYFEKYQEISSCLYRILLQFSACVQPVSIDEAYVDVSGLGETLTICGKIRSRFQKETGITVSAGASHNMLLAKIATNRAKPDGIFCIPVDHAEEFIMAMPVKDIPGVGYKSGKKMAEMKILTCSDVRLHSKQRLQQVFGNKTGEVIWEYARGIDNRPVKYEAKRQSVCAEINWGIRFSTNQDAVDTLQRLAEEVQGRLQQSKTRGRAIGLKVKRRKANAPPPQKYLGHGWCDNISRSVTLASSTDDKGRIAKEATSLLLGLQIDASEIRGLGIQISKLDDVGLSSNAENNKQSNIQKTLAKGKRVIHSGDQQQHKNSVPISIGPSKMVDCGHVMSLSQVDADVLAALPRDIQHEIKSRLRDDDGDRQHKNANAGGPISLGGGSSEGAVVMSGVTSLSQIDEDVLAALPQDIQREIRASLPRSRHEDLLPRSSNPQEDGPEVRSAEPSQAEEEGEFLQECSALGRDLNSASNALRMKDAVESYFKRTEEEEEEDLVDFSLSQEDDDDQRRWKFLEKYVLDLVKRNLENVGRFCRMLRLLQGSPSFATDQLQALESKINAEVRRVYGGSLS
jgi:DNA repair protein REV1